MSMLAIYTRFRVEDGTSRDFPALYVASRHEDMWEKRRPRKHIERMVWLLSERTSRPMLVLSKRGWILLDRESAQVAKGGIADAGTGGGNRRADAFVYPATGKAGAVPETQGDSGQTPVVEATGVPLAQPVGFALYTIVAVGVPDPAYDLLYVLRRPRKMVTDYLEQRITKETSR